MANPSEQVDHPTHYNKNPSGVECITIIRHMPHNVGAAVKYAWRAGDKVHEGETREEAMIRDYEKAIWYLQDQIKLVRGDFKND